ncbi:DUF4185 domain-containing protein [Panacibacter sp. DH6]|uniref:DUF4185 domain-containing protein n=1 Tax=Panacibacter microcysteis TaxID=2793269 RepID=A0A931E477_9BACT|nr:DUF4185 domain-containing protein [Panacibacter microcysteis]MBG9377340.1 DUF4185 domain-containing protein [Panacibacter microcysteis]
MKYKGYITALLCMFAAIACKTKDAAEADKKDEYSKSRITTQAVPGWAEMLRHDSGWIGADGIYCTALNGVEKPGAMNDASETMFWFSDCIIGDIDTEADTLKGSWQMMNNSVAYFTGASPDPGKIKYFWRKDSAGNPLSMFEPNTPNAPEKSYYWLGDGFMNHARDSTIYIFAYLIRNIPGGIYPFEDIGVSMIALPKNSRPPYAGQQQKETPLFFTDAKGKTVFGICVLPNTTGAGAPKPDGYVYVYGVRGMNKELVVARVQDTAFDNFSEWRFWDGLSWNTDMHACAALTDNISNEMSVTFMPDGRVIAAYQLKTANTTVAIAAGATPWGPFQPAKKVWETPEAYDDLDFYTYNAKAHPNLSKPGELLISYNVNSFDFLDDIVKHPHHLRPRFISVKY